MWIVKVKKLWYTTYNISSNNISSKKMKRAGVVMENNTFKSVAFGGFDKQDVIRYIEQSAQENAAILAKMEEEKQAVQDENTALQEQLALLREQFRELSEENGRLKPQVAVKELAERELVAVQEERDALQAELEKLRPQAEEYQKVKEQIGAIEFEARRRAAELEDVTAARLNRVLAACKAEYEEMTATFSSTAAHVTNELRKIEVNLAQLPRAMDQVGAEIADMESALKQNP